MNKHNETQESFLQPLVRPDFKPELFDSAIRQKGYKMVWEQSMLCSCYDLDSGQPDFRCTHCRGKGYVYFDPQEIRAVVTSLNGHKEQERIGLMDFGTAYLTPSSVDDVGFRDRFTFIDFTIKYTELGMIDPAVLLAAGVKCLNGTVRYQSPFFVLFFLGLAANLGFMS